MKPFIRLIIVLYTVAALRVGAAESLRHTLTSVERGIHVEEWKTSNYDVLRKSKPAFSVKKITLRGGKQDGVDLITVDNGKLKFSVIPTRGMSILRVESGDVRLGWDSPVKEIVHPKYINLQSRGGLGWLEGFSEWMVRCGLEWAGHPGKDKFINNVGEEAEMDLTLHGKIGNIPASEVEVIVDRDPPHRIRIRGRVDERMFYGPKLELWTEVSTEADSTSIRIEDTLTNRGAFDQEFQIIYHANFGAPLLEKGARLVAPVKQVTPFNAHAAESVNAYAVYEAPAKGFVEQVYCLHPLADEKNRTTFLLQNARADQGVSMSFSVEQLPYVTLWKNTNAGEEGYVTGIEPGTGFPANRRLERLAGRVPKLAPGTSRSFAIDVTLYSTREAVEEANAHVTKVRGNRQTQIDAAPAKME
jgi:hypothetical protein